MAIYNLFKFAKRNIILEMFFNLAVGSVFFLYILDEKKYVDGEQFQYKFMI